MSETEHREHREQDEGIEQDTFPLPEYLGSVEKSLVNQLFEMASDAEFQRRVEDLKSRSALRDNPNEPIQRGVVDGMQKALEVIAPLADRSGSYDWRKVIETRGEEKYLKRFGIPGDLERYKNRSKFAWET